MTLSKRAKDTYWHTVAHTCLSVGMKPAQVGKIVKEHFPQTEVNGRHIGAYKRRLINEGVLDKDIKPSAPEQIMKDNISNVVRELITEEDKFIYNCSVGSKIASLKCFEYKLEAQIEDIVDDCDEWIATIK